MISAEIISGNSLVLSNFCETEPHFLGYLKVTCEAHDQAYNTGLSHTWSRPIEINGHEVGHDLCQQQNQRE